ncbi:hypothetical protein [Streptomyces fradiae]|uniref:hypothetical protein n=1 Tax=Streptomyces fradiae TaxID=1906 RepID=UPI0035BE9C42
MSGARDRKEREVARLLAGAARPPVPPDLRARAEAYGRRVRRRERRRRRALWVLAVCAAVAFAAWACTAQPWAAPPMGTTPPLEPW